MTEADQIKTFQAMAEISRRWITVLDAKAGFLVAINGALLAFVWTGAKLPDNALHWVRVFVYVASGLSLISLLLAVSAVFPRIKLDTKPSVEPITFFAHVATKYGQAESSLFADAVLAMSDRALAREALEQHHAICHVALIKSSRVAYAAACWAAALISTAVAVLVAVAG